MPVPLPLPFLLGGGLTRTPDAPQCSQSCRLLLWQGSVHPAGLRLKLRQTSFGLPPPFVPPRGPRFLRHPALLPPASSSCGASSGTWCAGNGLNIFCPQPYSRKNLSLPVLPLAFCSPMLVKLCLTRLTRAPCAPPSLFGPRDGANRHPSSCLGLLTVITSNFGARSRVSPPGGYALQKAPPVALGRIPLWRTAPPGVSH